MNVASQCPYANCNKIVYTIAIKVNNTLDLLAKMQESCICKISIMEKWCQVIIICSLIN